MKKPLFLFGFVAIIVCCLSQQAAAQIKVRMISPAAGDTVRTIPEGVISSSVNDRGFKSHIRGGFNRSVTLRFFRL